MDKTLFYKLPKDILVELLCKTYDNLDLPIEDMYRIKDQCEKAILRKLEENRSILSTKYAITPNISIYFKYNGTSICIEDSTTSIKNSYPHSKRSIMEIKIFKEHHFPFCLYKIIDGKLELYSRDYRDVNTLIPDIKDGLKHYGDEILTESLKIIKLLLETFLYRNFDSRKCLDF